MKRTLAVIAVMFAFAVQAAPTQVSGLKWDPVPSVKGYKIYCAKDSNYKAITPVLSATAEAPIPPLADGTYTCVVTAYNDTQESQYSNVSQAFISTAGLFYPTDNPPSPGCPGFVPTPPPAVTYAVTANTSRTDGARPLQKLRDATLPYDATTNPLSYITGQYVAAGTLCEATPVVRTTTAGAYLYTTNAAGVRGITICAKQ